MEKSKKTPTDEAKREAVEALSGRSSERGYGINHGINQTSDEVPVA